MARILVIGSVARDDVVKMHERVREGTHLEGTWRGPRLGGGASCTAVPLAYAGHSVKVIGALGTDELGDELIAELAATGVDTSRIVRINHPSTRSIILVNGHSERTIVNVARTRGEDPKDRRLDVPVDCVCVRSRRLDLAQQLSEKAGECLIVAHVPPSEPGCRPAHILVASDTDVGPEVLDLPLDAGRRIAGDRLEWMIVTHGANGVTAYNRDDTIYVPAPRVSPVDTTGAGDSFAAGLVHALVSGAEMKEALETGAAWGAEATLWESSILPPDAVDRLTQLQAVANAPR